jgi:hypothetical protein
MREAGICGLAQVLAELELQPDGTVTGVRFLRTNNDDVKSAALRILASMNFTTTSNFVTYPIFEFKTIIDCTGAGISQEINSVPNYFYGPNDQDLLQKQRQQQGTQPGGAIQLPTDR